MKYSILILAFLLTSEYTFSTINSVGQKSQSLNEGIKDNPFIQESHIAYKISKSKTDNEVRSIAVDQQDNVWIATASGIFRKKPNSRDWDPIISGAERGPAYAVSVTSTGDVLLGTWDGLYRFGNHGLLKEKGVAGPVSVLCSDPKSDYAMGPNGLWQLLDGKWELQHFAIGRTLRDAATDGQGNLWIASDVGLFRCKDGKTKLYQNTNDLLSCYSRSVAFDQQGDQWVGVLGGVSVRSKDQLKYNLTPKEGIPSANVNCIRQSPNGTMWIGTNVGVVRFAKDGTHSLRFSKRWLTNDQVNALAFDQKGNAWIATANGVSEIKQTSMTLEQKEQNYYAQMMRKHIRDPWICGLLDLKIPGDTASWHRTDDDNDGEYTSGYLAMESFRFAATKNDDAHAKARKAFDFLKSLQTITQTDGFVARTIVPVGTLHVNDPNKTYTDKELAEELVKDPRFKPVEVRWHLSKDGKWLWKNDTSPDEMDGHMMGYFFFYELAANAEEKVLIRNHVKKIVDQLIKTNYNLVDVDGSHTHWGVWSPDQLNGDPDWASERSINSFELLAYLKFAFQLTDDQKYEKEYRRLIKDEGYLDNVSRLNKKNPAWQIYFDRTLEGYLFPILLRYEKDPKLKLFYNQLIEEWMAIQPAGENLINNLTYAFATGKKINIPQTIEFLKDAPLDLVDWPIDHTLREDVKIVRSPILEEIQISELPPASIRATVRWDKNPWAARQGDLSKVREPNFWLWPYWMARYFQIIKN